MAPRITKPDSERLFETTHPPIILFKDNCLVNLLIGFRHKVYLFDSYEMHTSKRANRAKVKRGPIGTFIEKGDISITNFFLKFVSNAMEEDIESMKWEWA